MVRQRVWMSPKNQQKSSRKSMLLSYTSNMSLKSSTKKKKKNHFRFWIDLGLFVYTLESAVTDVDIRNRRCYVVIHGDDSDGERVWIGLR